MGSSEDDDTPQDRPRVPRAKSQWDDGQRVEVGRKYRENPVRRDQLDELADALGDDVPRGEFDEDDNTKPIGLVLSPAEKFLNKRIDDVKAAKKREHRSTADQITEAMGKRPPNERLTAIETRLKIAFAILAAVGSVAAGAAVTVAKGLYERGETDGAHEIRLQNVERAVDALEHELGIPGRLFPPFTVPKGNTP